MEHAVDLPSTRGKANSRRRAHSTVVIIYFWATALIAIYTLTLRPSVSWRDSSEFVDIGYTLGIPHPPGSPTYALVAKLTTFLPVGAIGVRINLLSTLCAILALLLLAVDVALAHVRLRGSPLAGWRGGLLASCLLAVAPTFWNYATQAEVYMPFVLVVALLLFFGLRWDASQDDRFLYAGAFVFGLSGGIHGTSIFFAPALAYFVFTRIPKQRFLPVVALITAFGMLGAFVYLYLPLRAVTEPAFNWGHPDTWQRFWIQVSDRKDAQHHFPVMSASWLPHIKAFLHNVNTEVSLVGWPLALVGIAIAFRSPRLAIFTLLFCFGNVSFFILNWTFPEAYLPTFFLIAFWAGIALARAFEGGSPWRQITSFALALLVVVAFTIKVERWSWKIMEKVSDAARSAAEGNFLPLPEDSVAIVSANWFPMRYLQDAEGMRPDVTILLASDLAMPKHFTTVTHIRFTKLWFPENADKLSWDVFFEGIIRENLARVPVYWEPLDALNAKVYPYLRPWRYLWRFSDDKSKPVTKAEFEFYFSDLRGYLQREFSESSILNDPDESSYHDYLLRGSEQILRRQGRPGYAVGLLLLSSRLKPEDPSSVNELGRLYSGFQRWNDAEVMFKKAVNLLPDNQTPLLNLALLYMNMGRIKDARKTIRQAIQIDPQSPRPYHQLYLLEKNEGRVQEAKHALEAALARAEGKKSLQSWRSELSTLKVPQGGR